LAPDQSLSDFFLQPDGTIVFFGSIFDGNKSDPICGRLTKDGKLDSTFGTGGIVDLISARASIFLLESALFREVGLSLGSTGERFRIQKSTSLHWSPTGHSTKLSGKKGFCELENLPFSVRSSDYLPGG
jgi:hypothetical protein